MFKYEIYEYISDIFVVNTQITDLQKYANMICVMLVKSQLKIYIYKNVLGTTGYHIHTFK